MQLHVTTYHLQLSFIIFTTSHCILNLRLFLRLWCDH